MLGSHVLAEDFHGFGTLATRFVHRGFRHFDIDDSGFDESASFECVHRINP